MKTKLLAFLLMFIVALPLSAAPPYKKQTPGYMSASVDNDTYINVNRILMFVTNHGNFGRDLSGVFGLDAGTFFPYSTNEAIQSGLSANYCLYASGLWIGGKVQGQTRVAISEYSSEYVPGPMQNGTFSPDKAEYKVYKLYRDSLADNPNQDYLNWPYDQGAPATTDGDGNQIPDMIGDQMLWSVCNDADPDEHNNDAGETEPLGLEIRQTTFGFDRQGALGNIIFVRYRVYNKGANTINNCYISLWSDPDLGEYTDDFVGCDTNLSLGYVYNSDDDDAGFYEDKAPCTGYDFFQGPLIETGNNADTGRMWGELWPGYTNMGMVSFNKYINGTDPNDFNETYNYQQGLDASGEPYVYAGDTLLYMHSGDPVEGTGDLDIDPADRRWMQSTGPITFAPGDSTEILAAIIVGQGGNRFESITVTKELDDFAQRVYENNFNPPRPPAKPIVAPTHWPEEIVLTWDDISEREPGDFAFEGYSVWQGDGPTGPWTLLKTFDLASTTELALIDSVRDPDAGLVIPWIRRALTNQGLEYKYHITEDKVNGGPLREQKTYYFRVTAFSFSFWQFFENGDSARVPNADRLLESQTVMAIIPQPPPAGEHTDFGPVDTLPVVHTTGPSQGRVYPIVTDPRNLTGHTYQVVFDTLADGTPFWNLVDATLGEVVMDSMFDQSGAPGLRIVDGMYLDVLGAAVDFLSFQVVANGAGDLDPPVAGALDFGGFPTGVDADGVALRPDETQQVGDGMWGFHTADNGGSSGGGERGGYSAFLSRATRDGANFDVIGSFDYEMRFTGDNATPGTGGSYAIEAFNDDNVFWVPFELWNIGMDTPDDPSDDVRLFPLIIDDG
ncbi:MAG: hypothetical protein OEV68_16450, partial [candidate division Zixibacteria bacterium]|nr:hypothetical protein [candidate division Zixibacteria bacterium]